MKYVLLVLWTIVDFFFYILRFLFILIFKPTYIADQFLTGCDMADFFDTARTLADGDYNQAAYDYHSMGYRQGIRRMKWLLIIKRENINVDEVRKIAKKSYSNNPDNMSFFYDFRGEVNYPFGPFVDLFERIKLLFTDFEEYCYKKGNRLLFKFGYGRAFFFFYLGAKRTLSERCLKKLNYCTTRAEEAGLKVPFITSRKAEKITSNLQERMNSSQVKRKVEHRKQFWWNFRHPLLAKQKRAEKREEERKFAELARLEAERREKKKEEERQWRIDHPEEYKKQLEKEKDLKAARAEQKRQLEEENKRKAIEEENRRKEQAVLEAKRKEAEALERIEKEKQREIEEKERAEREKIYEEMRQAEEEERRREREKEFLEKQAYIDRQIAKLDAEIERDEANLRAYRERKEAERREREERIEAAQRRAAEERRKKQEALARLKALEEKQRQERASREAVQKKEEPKVKTPVVEEKPRIKETKHFSEGQLRLAIFKEIERIEWMTPEEGWERLFQDFIKEGITTYNVFYKKKNDGFDSTTKTFKNIRYTIIFDFYSSALNVKNMGNKLTKSSELYSAGSQETYDLAFDVAVRTPELYNAEDQANAERLLKFKKQVGERNAQIIRQNGINNLKEVAVQFSDYLWNAVVKPYLAQYNWENGPGEPITGFYKSTTYSHS